MVEGRPQRACGSNFLLGLARCQGKDLITEAWRTAVYAS
jgi:hypothetical protein